MWHRDRSFFSLLWFKFLCLRLLHQRIPGMSTAKDTNTAAAAASSSSSSSSSSNVNVISPPPTPIDPSHEYLYSLARNPVRNPVNVELEMSWRARIMSIKVGEQKIRERKERPKKRNDRPLDAAINQRQNERAERRRQKKRKTMKRCTSPSHFYIDPKQELQYGDDYTLDLPSRERMDSLLRTISAFYYRPKETHPNQMSVWVDNEYDQTQYSTLDLLVSPLRKVSARENWNNKEIALFESGMAKFPKDFYKIAKIIQTKTTQEVVKFYYTFWKHHRHYQLWKQCNPTDCSRARQQQQRQQVSSSSANTSNPPPASNLDSSALNGSAQVTSTHIILPMMDATTHKSFAQFLVPTSSSSQESIRYDSDSDERQEAEKVKEEKRGETETSATTYCCKIPVQFSKTSTSSPTPTCNQKFTNTNALAAHIRTNHQVPDSTPGCIEVQQNDSQN